MPIVEVSSRTSVCWNPGSAVNSLGLRFGAFWKLPGLFDGKDFHQCQVSSLMVDPPLAHVFKFSVGMFVLEDGGHPRNQMLLTGRDTSNLDQTGKEIVLTSRTTQIN